MNNDLFIVKSLFFEIYSFFYKINLLFFNIFFMRKKSFLLGWIALLVPLVTLWAKEATVSSIWYTGNISNESIIEIKWTDLENCTTLKVAGKNIEIKNKSAQSLSYNFSDSKEYSGSLWLTCDGKDINFYYSFPYISNITFQTSKWSERSITISGKWFTDSPNIIVEWGSFQAKVRNDDVISGDLPENLTSSGIYIERNGLKSNVFDLWIKIPKIKFIFSESGFIKGTNVTIFGDNLTTAQDTSIHVGTSETSGTKNADGTLSFILPNDIGSKKIYVLSQGIKSNTLDINITWERPEITEVWERTIEGNTSGKKQLYIKGKNYSETQSENKIELNGKIVSISSQEWNIFTINDYILQPGENILSFIVSNKVSKVYSYQASHISLPSIGAVSVGALDTSWNRDFSLSLDGFNQTTDSIYLWWSKVSIKECVFNTCKVSLWAGTLKWYFTVWRWDIINPTKIYFDKVFENTPYISDVKFAWDLKSWTRVTITGGNFEWATVTATNFFAKESDKLDFSQGSNTISWLLPLDFNPEAKSTITITKYGQSTTFEFQASQVWKTLQFKWAPVIEKIQPSNQNEVLKPQTKVEVLWRGFDYGNIVEIGWVKTELVFQPQQNAYFIMPEMQNYGVQSLIITNKDGQKSNKIDFILSKPSDKKEVTFHYQTNTNTPFSTDDNETLKQALYNFSLINVIDDMIIKQLVFQVNNYKSSDNLGTFQLNIWKDKYGPNSINKDGKIIFKDIFIEKSANEISAELLKSSAFTQEWKYTLELSQDATILSKISGEVFSGKSFHNFVANTIEITLNQKINCIDSDSNKTNCNTYLKTSEVFPPVKENETPKNDTVTSETKTETTTNWKKEVTINTLNFKTSGMIQLNKNFNTLAQKLVNLEKNQGKEEEIKKTINLILVGLYQYESSKKWESKRQLALKIISTEVWNLKKFLK